MPQKDTFGSRMTETLARHSGSSPLVIITLPQRQPGQDGSVWMQSVDTLVGPLQRVIFIQESGKEKVQFYR